MSQLVGVFTTVYWQIDWDIVEDIDNIARKTSGHSWEMPITIDHLPKTVGEIEKIRSSSSTPFKYDNKYYLEMFQEIQKFWDDGKASKVLFI